MLRNDLLLFNKAPNLIYLNNGTHSLTPLSILESMQKYRMQYEMNPTFGLIEAPQKIWESQKLIARFLNANPKNIFFRNNITEALNDIILGAPLPQNSEILISNQEYGAVTNICRVTAKKKNCEIKKIILPDEQEIQNTKPSNILERVISAFTSKTKMLVLSEIYSSSGLLLPILEIAKETKKRNIFFIVDGAHSPGYLPLDFSQYNDVDAYAGNLHKWFMGPKGTAFGWIHDQHKEYYQSLYSGWTTFEAMEPFNAFAEGDCFAIRMLMVGCRDFSNIFALKDTVLFWEKFGATNIYGKIRNLGDFLEKSVQDKFQTTRFASYDKSLQGPLYSYALPTRFQNENAQSIMLNILSKTNVQVNITTINGQKYLRLSPHIYNTESEITEAIDRLCMFMD